MKNNKCYKKSHLNAIKINICVFILNDMSRPRLTEQDKKIKLSITISRESNIVLEKLTNNKSKFIEEIIMIIANEKNRK